MKSKLESQLAGRLREGVRAKGGMTVVLMPTVAGVPDRLVLHAGRMFLVELKAETGQLRPIQKVWHGQAAERGVTVVVLRGQDEIERWVEEL